MSDLNWVGMVSAAIVAFGAPALGAALLLGALGLPLPGTLIVLAAGASVQQGILNGPEALTAGLIGAVLGDALSYGLGRLMGGRRPLPLAQSRPWRSASAALVRRGDWVIYLSRFWLTPVALPVNLLAGSSGYGFRRFLWSDMLGELTWLLLYGGVGYAVGSGWEVAGASMAAAGQALLVALLAGGGLLLALRATGSPSMALTHRQDDDKLALTR